MMAHLLNRFSAMLRILLPTVISGLGFLFSGDAAAAHRPNIIFVLVDALGSGDVGFRGGKEIKTPHIDRIAQSGAILDQFYVQPVCSPTRAAFLTGRYPMRYGLQ